MNKVKYLLFSLFLLLFSVPHVFASGSATLSFSGSSSVIVGNNIEVILQVSNLNGINGGIAAVGGRISFDSNYLEYVSSQSLAPYTISYASGSGKIAGLAFSEDTRIKSSTSLIKFTFKTKKTGNTSISFNEVSLTDGTSDAISANNTSKSINITEPPSSNNNLSSLTVSEGSLNFNKNTTSYNVNVDSDVTSININATAEDSKASVSGTGTKSLKYGNNSFDIVVTAASGAKKTYTVNVNRKDNRSSNNNLSRLTISTGTLSPSFNKNTTTYTVSVPFEVSSVSVKATAEDSKAKVSVSGGSNLPAEETTNITIKVTAENGSVKTYTIKVTRGKDPNKVLSTNNNLSSLVPSVGELSPIFDKDSLNYEVYVSYDVKEIEFTTTVEDTKYATVNIDGPESLSVGKNKYSITVTAEDGSTKEYIVTVTRAKDPNAPASTNTFLKEILISNGTLRDSFDKNQYVYYYESDQEIEVAATAEDEDSKVVILESDGIYTIYVEAPSGDAASYVLIPYEKNSSIIWYIIIAAILTVGGGFAGYFASQKNIFKSKNPKKESKKEKKKTNKKENKNITE